MEEINELKEKLKKLLEVKTRDLNMTIAIHNLQQMISERERKLKA